MKKLQTICSQGNPAYEVFLKENDKVTIVVESKNPNPQSIEDVDVYDYEGMEELIDE